MATFGAPAPPFQTLNHAISDEETQKKILKNFSSAVDGAKYGQGCQLFSQGTSSVLIEGPDGIGSMVSEIGQKIQVL